MNGIEKIKARIAADTDAEIERLRGETETQCEEIRARFERQAQEEYWALVQAGVQKTERHVQRLDRNARLEARKSILGMKQELVSAAFDMARERLLAMPEEEYVDFLSRQAAAASVSGQEEIILNAEDRARCGAEVARRANERLRERGIQPALSLGEPRGFSGGLFLRHGDIEVNCTLDALLELARVELSAQVAEVLFPPEA